MYTVLAQIRGQMLIKLWMFHSGGLLEMWKSGLLGQKSGGLIKNGFLFARIRYMIREVKDKFGLNWWFPWGAIAETCSKWLELPQNYKIG